MLSNEFFERPPLIGEIHYFSSGWYYSGVIEGYLDGYAYLRVSDGIVKVVIENLNVEKPGQFHTSKPGHGKNNYPSQDKFLNDFYN